MADAARAAKARLVMLFPKAQPPFEHVIRAQPPYFEDLERSLQVIGEHSHQVTGSVRELVDLENSDWFNGSLVAAKEALETSKRV